MNLQDKKRALMNTNQPSGYEVTITTSNSGRNISVTINGETTTYSRTSGVNIDCGCVYLCQSNINSDNYTIIAKGNVEYNGISYTKGHQINRWNFAYNQTHSYSGTDQPTPSKVTEFYMPSSLRYAVFTDTEFFAERYQNVSNYHQIGCIEFNYTSGKTTIKAIKDLIYNGATYSVGDTVTQIRLSGTLNAVFEEI